MSSIGEAINPKWVHCYRPLREAGSILA